MSYFYKTIFTYKKKFISFFFLLLISIIMNYYFQNNKKRIKDFPYYKYNQVISFYPKAKNFKLNYNKKCGEIFKYKPNNKKDLVILAYEFQNRNFRHNLFIEIAIGKVLDSYKNSIPNAYFICFVPKKSINTKIVKEIKKYNIEIIEISNSKEHITNRRFIETYKYLKEKKNNFERVLHIDIDDIYIFGDIFATIGENDLYVNYNCNIESTKLERCRRFFKSANKKWFKKNINKYNSNEREIKNFKSKKPLTIIAGVFVGGIKNFYKFIELYSQKLIQFNNKNQMRNFGYDQILFNYLYYNDYFKQINLKVIGCEQRMCFRPRNLLFNNKTTKIFYENSGCSPILIHKGYPNSWISLESKYLKKFNSL